MLIQYSIAHYLHLAQKTDSNFRITFASQKHYTKYLYLYITDVELINGRFDLAFYYYLVSYYTTCVQHSSDKTGQSSTKSTVDQFHICYTYLYIHVCLVAVVTQLLFALGF